MFDLSWTELLFCGVLGLIVVGPKDLPKLMHALGYAVRRMKSVYHDMQAGLGTLEREIDLAGNAGKKNSLIDFLPEEIQNLPDYLPENYLPGSLSAEEYRRRREAYDRQVEALRQQAAARQKIAEKSES